MRASSVSDLRGKQVASSQRTWRKASQRVDRHGPVRRGVTSFGAHVPGARAYRRRVPLGSVPSRGQTRRTTLPGTGTRFVRRLQALSTMYRARRFCELRARRGREPEEVVLPRISSRVEVGAGEGIEPQRSTPSPRPHGRSSRVRRVARRVGPLKQGSALVEPAPGGMLRHPAPRRRSRSATQEGSQRVRGGPHACAPQPRATGAEVPLEGFP